MLIEWFDSYKRTLRCVRCGFGDWRALVFHHRDRKTKEGNLSECPRRGWSKKRILAEAAKCDVLCANCHAIEHHGDR
jgi:hypothetical protein